MDMTGSPPCIERPLRMCGSAVPRAQQPAASVMPCLRWRPCPHAVGATATVLEARRRGLAPNGSPSRLSAHAADGLAVPGAALADAGATCMWKGELSERLT